MLDGIKSMAGKPGFEPRSLGPEPRVLPLNYFPMPYYEMTFVFCKDVFSAHIQGREKFLHGSHTHQNAAQQICGKQQSRKMPVPILLLVDFARMF